MAKTDTKAILAAAKKYHFWVCCASALITGIAIWATATSDLADQYQKREKKLTEDMKAMKAIEDELNFPNEKVVKAIETQTAAQDKKVREAWVLLYDDQQKNNPWPAILGKDFLDYIQGLPPRAEISEPYREIYQTFIGKYLPKLLILVEARHEVAKAGAPAAAAAPLGANPANAPHGEKSGLVDWIDFDKIKEPFKWPSTPNSLQVWLAQEDLWVYEALLRIIKDTNRDASDHDRAAIKQIETLEIGQAASDSWERVQNNKIIPLSAGEEGPGGGNPLAGRGPQPDQPGGGAVLDVATKRLLNRRYVDEKGKPLAADEKQPFKELNMMPIHMRLLVNQNMIPRLLVQCANSSMPVEVRQIRWGVGEASEESGKADTGQEPPRHDGSSGSTPAPAVAAAAAEHSHGLEYVTLDVPVEIFGTISIYNRPPEVKKADGQPQGQAPVEGTPR